MEKLKYKRGKKEILIRVILWICLNFFGKLKRRDYSGIESWDTSNVVDMGGMFYEAESFSQPLEKWNTSKVEQYKNKNKANSNISTQQTQLTKQPATNMIRCDDRKILKHIIQQDKNGTMNLYNNRDEI